MKSSAEKRTAVKTASSANFLDVCMRLNHFLAAVVKCLADKPIEDIPLTDAIHERLETLGWPADSVREQMVDVLLENILLSTELAAYGNVTVAALMEDSVTTGEAATIMGVSRQHVVDLANRGVLSVRMVGRYRRLDRKEVVDYFATGLKRSAAAAAALVKFEASPVAGSPVSTLTGEG